MQHKVFLVAVVKTESNQLLNSMAVPLAKTGSAITAFVSEIAAPNIVPFWLGYVGVIFWLHGYACSPRTGS